LELLIGKRPYEEKKIFETPVTENIAVSQPKVEPLQSDPSESI
jgi:hypothetical protein